MIRNLYYYNWPLQESVFAVVIDDLKERIAHGDEVFFVSCKGSLLPCKSNLQLDKRKCELCQFNHKGAFRDSFSGIKHLYIDSYCQQNEVEAAFRENSMGAYSTIKDIKALQFQGIDIGYGALSTYISATRNRNPLLDDDFRAFFNQLLKVEIFIAISIGRIINKIQPDVVTIFNGRIHDTRPVYQTAINKGIPLRGVETIVKGQWDWYRRVFENALPHDIAYHTKAINDAWEQSSLSEKEKVEVARKFYEGRRNKQLVRDVKIYVKDQVEGMLPEGFDPKRHNICIFNSSDDEFAAIGSDWEDLNLFEDQLKGIKWILQNCKDENIHFYLRIHPNLRAVAYSYHTDLYKLSAQFDNCTVIPSDSPVSTYTLMDAVDKVIVFGSSTGVEAAYAGKPVILLSGTFYHPLAVSYNPTSTDQFSSLVLNKQLKPKSPEGAYKFAFYLMSFDEYSQPISTNVISFKVAGKTLFHYFPHLTFWRSSLLHKIGIWCIRLKIKFKKSIRQTIPAKEAPNS